MSRNAVGGLASVIIPSWNQLEFTRQCIAALVRHTRRPWELIAVDNGSTDGTALYLSGVQDAAAVPVIVISNKENRGFPAAINQGLQQARGEYLVLLNNDVVVTDAWLDQLIALAEMQIESRAEGNPPPYPPPQGSDFLRIIDFHCPFRDRRGLERRSLAIQRCVFSAAAGSLPGFASRLSPRSPRWCAVWPLPSPCEADIAVQFHQHVIEPTHHLPG